MPTQDNRTRDELDDLLDEYWDSFPDIEVLIRDFRPKAMAQARSLAEALLRYAWTVRRPLAEHWLTIISSGFLMTDNIKELRRDAEVRTELDEWMPADMAEANLAYRQLFTSAGLADSVHAPFVVTLPSTQAARGLIEIANRYYLNIPYGGCHSRYAATAAEARYDKQGNPTTAGPVV